jgi:hypothetical protein
MRSALFALVVLVIGGCKEGAPAGAQCLRGDDCASGFCRGFDCGATGICIEPEAHEECTPEADLPGHYPACTCDGEQLDRVRPGCPSERLAWLGRCDWPGNVDPPGTPDAGDFPPCYYPGECDDAGVGVGDAGRPDAGAPDAMPDAGERN